ncbi:MAG: hypothetical protein H6730_32055 [Deltaproteobacteria bacterium]|nr:hypothetical protein [Deltaproteobacteria bacterium]
MTPPDGQLYFPHALLVEPGANRLLAVSTNFDQRYNAGRIHAFDVPALIGLIPADRSQVHFVEDFGAAHLGSLRIDQFAGDIVLTEAITGFTGTGAVRRVLVPSRGRNYLTMLDYKPGDAMPLSCGTAPEPPARFDCPEIRSVSTGNQDPFSVTAFTTTAQVPLAVVAHLRSQVDSSSVYRQSITTVNLKGFAERVESGEPDALPNPVNVQDYLLGGATGVQFLPAGYLGLTPGDAEGTVVLLGARRTTNLTMSAFRMRESDGAYSLDDTADNFVNLGTTAAALATRGMVFDADRARFYVSLRFQETADSYNSGIAVIDPTGDELRLVSVIEVGEELGKPSLRIDPAGNHLLYVPDIRRDTVWIVDVSTDEPTLVHKVNGVGTRSFDGQLVQVPLLASPTQVAFASDGQGNAYAFVTNFSNSTLAVLDITDPDPRHHEVVARLGRDINPEGEKEGP